jgi:anti-sigma factor RsiW
MSRMECSQVLQLISAYADGELDARQRAETEDHLRSCADCARALDGLSTLKTAMGQESLLYRAPPALHDKILHLLDQAAGEPPTEQTNKPRPTRRWTLIAGAIAAILAIAIGLSAYLLLWPSHQQKRLATEAVLDQQRATQANHLVDIASSDQQKVSLWLDAKLNFAPWVPAQAPPGYALLGARVDMLDGRDVAALVYRNNDHITNIFQWPMSPKDAVVNVSSIPIQGLHATRWNNPAWNFFAISDADPASIKPLIDMFAIESCSTPAR